MKIGIGTRTLIAATCRKCGKFLDGSRFGRHRRNYTDKHAYLDLRCAACRWGGKVSSDR